MKRILFIGYNYAPELTGIGKYSGEMVHWLARRGYECTVVTTYPYYPHWKVEGTYAAKRFGYTTESQAFASGGCIRVHRCPMYVPANPTGMKRILLDLSFLITAFFKLLQLLFQNRFETVITIVPSFLLGFVGIFCKMMHGAKMHYHIHDLQIEAARDLGMIKSARIINLLFSLERFIFRHADYITCTGEGMTRITQEKTPKPVRHFANWAETRTFYPVENHALLKQKWGFDTADKVLLYAGAIGEKQGLEVILQAAKALEDNRHLKFLICGTGPYKEKLEGKAKSMALQNVIFYPLQPLEKFNFFLNMADVHLVIQKSCASDLVMPSKLTTILSVGGLALVTANPGSGLHQVVNQHQMGLLVQAEDLQALISGIELSTTREHEQIRINARRYAEAYLSIDSIMEAYEANYLQPAYAPESKLEPTAALPISNIA